MRRGDNKPSSTNYRYIKVHGAAPTLKSVMDGSYSFFVQNAFNDKFFSGSSAQRTIWDRVYNIIGNVGVPWCQAVDPRRHPPGYRASRS